MKCGMTEKKAKDILMLLAKKAGFDDIEFSASYDDMLHLGCVKKSKNYSKGYFIGWVNCKLFSGDGNTFRNVNVFHTLKSSRKSYRYFLEMMLGVAKVYDIKTCSPENGVVVMQKGTTLEELLVELDLLDAMANGK